MHVSGPFCAYATVINETPGVLELGSLATQLLLIGLKPL